MRSRLRGNDMAVLRSTKDVLRNVEDLRQAEIDLATGRVLDGLSPEAIAV